MKTLIIKDHKHGGVDIIQNIPDHISGNDIVEKWGKASIHYAVHHTLPGCTWKIAESNNFVDAMIESTRL